MTSNGSNSPRLLQLLSNTAHASSLTPVRQRDRQGSPNLRRMINHPAVPVRRRRLLQEPGGTQVSGPRKGCLSPKDHAGLSANPISCGGSCCVATTIFSFRSTTAARAGRRLSLFPGQGKRGFFFFLLFRGNALYPSSRSSRTGTLARVRASRSRAR